MLDILETAARKGGDVLTKYFRREMTVTHKTSHHNIVTKADIESQDIIQKTLLDLSVKRSIPMEDVGFIGEENLLSRGKYTYIIDPLDGTSNFACSLPYFCVSIGLAIDGVLTHGVVFDPITNRLFSAQKGKGACVKIGTTIRRLTCKPNDLSAQFLSVHFSSHTEVTEEIIKILPKLLDNFRSVRTLGSITLELCDTADGIFGIILNGSCYIWDIAAAALILQEAGGTIVDWQGNPLVYDLTETARRYEIVAGREQNVNKIVSLLARA